MGTASGVADNGLAALGSRHGTRERDTKSLPSFLPSFLPRATNSLSLHTCSVPGGGFPLNEEKEAEEEDWLRVSLSLSPSLSLPLPLVRSLARSV